MAFLIKVIDYVKCARKKLSFVNYFPYSPATDRQPANLFTAGYVSLTQQKEQSPVGEKAITVLLFLSKLYCLLFCLNRAEGSFPLHACGHYQCTTSQLDYRRVLAENF